MAPVLDFFSGAAGKAAAYKVNKRPISLLSNLFSLSIRSFGSQLLNRALFK